MARILFSQYHKEDLLELTERLNKDYYEVIDELCRNAATHAAELQEIEDHPSTTLYISLCVKLIEEIRFHIRMRKQVLIPYIHQLMKKVAGNHDCRSCAGGCAFQHETQAESVREAHQQIKEILDKVQQLARPLYLESTQPLSYKILRNEIMIIDTALTELFYLEESVLIPKIIAAQKLINAIR